MQKTLTVKTPNKLEIEEILLNLKKGIYEKPMVHV